MMKAFETLLYPTIKPYKHALESLAQAPFEMRIVGGAVRDAIRGHAIKELDMAAQCTYQQLIEFCQNHAIRIVTENPTHGNIKILLFNNIIDITILRKDTETDGRHAVITTTDDWLEDARRRDFTINALYIDSSGTLHDPLADINQSGLADIKGKVLRFIDNGEQRIQEDYLRILRFFRFQAVLEYSVLEDDIQSIKRHLKGLKKISRERISAEWLRLIMANNPINVLQEMKQIGIFTILWDDCPVDIDYFEQFLIRCSRLSFLASFPLRLAVLHRNSTAQTIKHTLLLSKAVAQHIADIHRPALKSELHALYYFGTEVAQHRKIFHQNGLEKHEWEDFLSKNRPIFPLNGHDFKKIGLKNKKIGDYTRIIEDIWLKDGAIMNKKQLLEVLKAILVQSDENSLPRPHDPL